MIDVKSLLVRGVQKEEKAAVEKSFMRNIYFQASQLVRAIVEFDADVPADCLAYRSECHNVIAFTGRRGTGKTSAMVSFAKFLQELDFLKKYRIEHARFYALRNHIDASMFTKSDYLLRSILSEMYLDMKKKQERGNNYRDDAQFRRLRTQFVKILQDYNAVTQVSKENNNAENELEAQTDRLFIKSCMEKLVKEYLSCMMRTDCRDETANNYLVICIDDIDMAKQNQSDIVNEIYLYLMIPHVIVLFTADFRGLKLALQKDFYNSLKFGKEENEEIMIASNRQARNYLQKIVPSDMRITMPSWKKVDYRELYPVIIDTTHYLELKRLSDCISIPPERIKPKKFILFLLAKRTECLLDLGGDKLHFMEPESLRDLYDKFYLLYNMESLSVKDAQVRAARLKNNRKILLDYLHFKIIPELELQSLEEVFARELLSLPIERRGKRIWEFYYDCLRNAPNREMIINRFGQDFYNKELRLEQDRYFCMGEVFRVLFTASRIGIFGKDFVKLLLASYSFAMPQYIESLESALAQNDLHLLMEYHDRQQQLRKMFGSSLLGQWIGQGSGNGFSVSIPLDEIGQKDGFKWDDVCRLSLLSSNICFATNHGISIDFSAMTVVIDCMDITALPLNIMDLQILSANFMVSLLGYEQVQVQVREDSDARELLEARFRRGPYSDDVCEHFLDCLEQFNRSFCGLLKELRRTPVPLSFMLKHIDMTYNILKRLMIGGYYDSADNPAQHKGVKPSNLDQSFKRFIERLKELYEWQLTAYYGKTIIEDTEFAFDFALLGNILGAINELGANSDAKWEWKDYSKPATPPVSQDSEEVTQVPEEGTQVPEDGTPTSDEGTAE